MQFKLANETSQNFQSFHICRFHLGTGINNPQSFKAALQKSYEIFIYGKKLGFNFTILDIGGGFKGDTDSLSELNDLAEVINAFLKTSFEEFPNLRPLAEPGAFFSTSPFIVCLKVVSKVKEKSDGRDVRKLYSYMDV